MTEEEISKSPYAPSVGVKLVCWFGIYFAAQLPFIFFIIFFWAYPIGLATCLLSGFPAIEHLQDAKIIAYVLAYGFYFGHLIWSVSTRSRQTFIVLMIILIVAACLNSAGCSSDMAGLGQIKG